MPYSFSELKIVWNSLENSLEIFDIFVFMFINDIGLKF